MKQPPLLLAVLIVASWVITGCKTEASSPTAAPSFTPVIGTATSQPSTPVPCFFTYYDPLAFWSDSSFLLVRARAGVQSFNLKSMKESAFYIAPTDLNGPSVALSPDGDMFAWALEGGAIEWFRFDSFEKVTTIRTRQRGPLKLEFSPTGDQLYSVSHFDGLKVWGTNGEMLHSLEPGGELMNIGISPDGQVLAILPADGPVSLWAVEDLHLIKELGGSGGYDTSDVAFSPDGQHLAADLSTGLYLWKLADGSELLGAEDGIKSMAVAFSPDGRYLAYASLNKVVLSTPDGSQVIRTLEGHRSPVFEVLFSPDSAMLVSADEREIRLWRVEDGVQLAIGKSNCAF